MSRWAPCKRREFIGRLRRLGFRGPYSGTRHEFMVYGNFRLSIPSNPDYSIPQLKMMLEEVEKIINRKISLQEWESLK